MKCSHRLERLLLIFGMGSAAIYLSARIHALTSSWGDRQTFEAIQRLVPADSDEGTDQQLLSGRPNFRLWAKERIRDYEESLLRRFPPPIAVLRISKIRLKTPVWEGTDDLTLNRGVGWIEGTARVDGSGNVGIAGHRDGFFRGLKDLRIGDSMDLVTRTRTDTYAVSKFQIVDPNDASVLEPTTTPSLTLVTCYPFYFIGRAPQRYIVHASIQNSRPLNASGNDQTTFKLHSQ